MQVSGRETAVSVRPPVQARSVPATAGVNGKLIRCLSFKGSGLNSPGLPFRAAVAVLRARKRPIALRVNAGRRRATT